VQRHYYDAYYRPVGYSFDDVIDSIHRAKRNGLFTMLNYLVFPGISDHEAEIKALEQLIESSRLDLIQMRNLSIDPTLYWNSLAATGNGIGMVRMLARLKKNFPELQFGYFNRTRETFYPAGYQNDWPLPAQC
jgi:hypothetical protein